MPRSRSGAIREVRIQAKPPQFVLAGNSENPSAVTSTTRTRRNSPITELPQVARDGSEAPSPAESEAAARNTCFAISGARNAIGESPLAISCRKIAGEHGQTEEEHQDEDRLA